MQRASSSGSPYGAAAVLTPCLCETLRLCGSASSVTQQGTRPREAKHPLVLLPKTRKEVVLNRVRIWLPPVFVLIGLAVGKPRWDLWGLPLVILGEGLRTWAAGNLIKDETLTVGGPYAFVRNPLYLGSLLSGVGFMLIVGELAAGPRLPRRLPRHLPTHRAAGAGLLAAHVR